MSISRKNPTENIRKGHIDFEDTSFSATGLDPSLTRLFPDGQHLSPHRTLCRSNTISSPFYDRPGQIVVGDHYEDRPHLTIKHEKIAF